MVVRLVLVFLQLKVTSCNSLEIAREGCAVCMSDVNPGVDWGVWSVVNKWTAGWRCVSPCMK